MQIVQKTNVLGGLMNGAMHKKHILFVKKKEKYTKQSKINRIKQENKYIFSSSKPKQKSYGPSATD
jgi:hypothetical protein